MASWTVEFCIGVVVKYSFAIRAINPTCNSHVKFCVFIRWQVLGGKCFKRVLITAKRRRERATANLQMTKSRGTISSICFVFLHAALWAIFNLVKVFTTAASLSQSSSWNYLRLRILLRKFKVPTYEHPSGKDCVSSVLFLGFVLTT